MTDPAIGKLVCDGPEAATVNLVEHPEGPEIARRVAALCTSPEVQFDLLPTVWRGAGALALGTLSRGDVVIPLRIFEFHGEHASTEYIVERFSGKIRWWVDYLMGGAS